MNIKKNKAMRLIYTLILFLFVKLNFGQSKNAFETNNEDVKPFIYAYYTSFENNSNSRLLDQIKIYLPEINLKGKNISVFYDKAHIKKATEVTFDTTKLKFEITHYDIKGDIVLKYNSYYYKSDNYIGIQANSPYTRYFHVSFWKLIELSEYNNKVLISNLIRDDSGCIGKFIKGEENTEYIYLMYYSSNEFELSHYIEKTYYSNKVLKSLAIITPYFIVDTEGNEIMEHHVEQFKYDLNGCLFK